MYDSHRTQVMAMLLRIASMLLCCLVVVSLASAEDLVANGGFEEPAEGPPTTITPWGRWQSSAQTAYRVADQKTEGDWALFIKMNVAAGAQVVQQKLKDYQAGQLYEIVFQARSAEAYDSFIVDVLEQSLHQSRLDPVQPPFHRTRGSRPSALSALLPARAEDGRGGVPG